MKGYYLGRTVSSKLGWLGEKTIGAKAQKMLDLMQEVVEKLTITTSFRA